MNRVQLREDIITAFNESALHELCDALEIEYEALNGHTLRDRVGVLIGTLERKQRLAQLVEAVVTKRPSLAQRYAQWGSAASVAPEGVDLSWLDQVAGGKGPPIEEPPTMTWESQTFSAQEDEAKGQKEKKIDREES